MGMRSSSLCSVSDSLSDSGSSGSAKGCFWGGEREGRGGEGRGGEWREGGEGRGKGGEGSGGKERRGGEKAVGREGGENNA